jgi:hypothetical protein
MGDGHIGPLFLTAALDESLVNFMPRQRYKPGKSSRNHWIGDGWAPERV